MQNILNAIIAQGGYPLYVGGYVRDQLLGVPSKDIDIEVYDMLYDDLIDVLSQFGHVNTVGASFGVIKLRTHDNQEIDFSFPRRDSKSSKGHKGFTIEIDPGMTPFDAALRRDFTINSMAMTKDGKIIDFFNGQEDLRKGILRHTSDAFVEDPLRVLRGFQFCGRFDLYSTLHTYAMCRGLVGEYQHLSIERVWGEWWKWASKSQKPSAGLEFLLRAGWLRLFPEVFHTIKVPQEPEWHPEGDVFEHTLHVVDKAAEIAVREDLLEVERGVLVLSALCHDMGKASTTRLSDDGLRIVSPGHAHTSHTKDFLQSIGAPKSISCRVQEIVREHMVHLNDVSDKTVRRFLSRLNYATYQDVIYLIEADHSGRPPLPGGLPQNAKRIREIAYGMGNEILPIVMGRHLIELGLKPGTHFGNILEQAFEAQLDGEFYDVESGKTWVSQHFMTL